MTTAQLDNLPLFNPSDIMVDVPTVGTLEDRFARFNAANPHIYRALAILARRAVARGVRHIGIASLYEVCRWEWNLTRPAGEEFKLNNNWRAYYARALMRNEADLRGIFETRVTQGERRQ